MRKVVRPMLITVVVGTAACTSGGEGEVSRASVVTSPPSTAPATTATTYEVTRGLPDGAYEVIIQGADAAAQTLDVDLVQRLSGDAALHAYVAEHPEDPTGPPNDYYILNNEPRVWRVSVAPNAKLNLVDRFRGFEVRPGSVAELADGDQWFCDVVIRDHAVVQLTEGYHP